MELNPCGVPAERADMTEAWPGRLKPEGARVSLMLAWEVLMKRTTCVVPEDIGRAACTALVEDESEVRAVLTLELKTCTCPTAAELEEVRLLSGALA